VDAANVDLERALERRLGRVRLDDPRFGVGLSDAPDKESDGAALV
jgi:hypothetical protein